MTDHDNISPTEAEAHFEQANPEEDNSFRHLAEEHLRNGTVTEATTIADVRTILERHHAVKQ